MKWAEFKTHDSRELGIPDWQKKLVALTRQKTFE